MPVFLSLFVSTESLPSLKKESLTGSETRSVVQDKVYINKFRAEEDDEEVEEVS